ncbi:MAG: hypothetical protein ABJA02_15105 [Acidobacteriota bacterium]
MHHIAFESYGVRFYIQSNRRSTLARSVRVAQTAMLGRLTEIQFDPAFSGFVVRETSDGLNLELDGEDLGGNPYKRGFYHYFGSRVKVLVAAAAKDVVFVHAGVIGWKGKAALFPADSHVGKSTLTAALIRRGAVYFSDDYAIVDKNGLVHPFPRKLSIRHRDGSGEWTDRSASTYGAVTGDHPLPIGAAILTRYEERSRWRPKVLTPGVGLLETIPFVIPFNENPAISLSVLKNALAPAIIAKSLRPDADLCADAILHFIDKILF